MKNFACLALAKHRTTLLAVLLLTVFAVLPARAYELVEVRSGDVLLVRLDGGELSLRLAGVWVPTPPGLGQRVHYRGAEARRFVLHVLRTERAWVREVEPDAAKPKSGELAVRIRVGVEGKDLSVLLTEAGLALADRGSAADGAHGEAIHLAERAARREARGMHDGGLQGFNASEGQTVDLGTVMMAASLIRYRGSRFFPTGSAAAGGRSTTVRNNRVPDIHRTGQEAIRDWGAEMGLPRDSSATGR